MNTSKNLEILRKNGWLLIKNFFDDTFCDNLRESCITASKDGMVTADLLSNKYTNHLFTNEKFIKIISELLGDKPVYFGDSGYQIASVKGNVPHGFHKDCVDRKNQKGIDWEEDYSLIRVGIYLQDHKNFSEGLVVRTNSHKTPDLTVGKKVNVPSQKGDIIIWYLTTTHSGNARRIKGITNLVLMGDKTGSRLSNWLYHNLPKNLIQPSEKDRVALFLTFGKNDRHLKRYINYLKHRSYMVDIWKNINYEKSLLEKIKLQGMLEVIDMKEDALCIDSVKYPEYNFDQFQNYHI